MEPDEPVRLETEDARSGSTPHVTRYVLGISLPLIILLFVLVWLFMFHNA